MDPYVNSISELLATVSPNSSIALVSFRASSNVLKMFSSCDRLALWHFRNFIFSLNPMPHSVSAKSASSTQLIVSFHSFRLLGILQTTISSSRPGSSPLHFLMSLRLRVLSWLLWLYSQMPSPPPSPPLAFWLPLQYCNQLVNLIASRLLCDILNALHQRHNSFRPELYFGNRDFIHKVLKPIQEVLDAVAPSDTAATEIFLVARVLFPPLNLLWIEVPHDHWLYDTASCPPLLSDQCFCN